MIKEMNQKNYPVLMTRNVVLFPGLEIKIDVGREFSVQALYAAQANDGLIFIATQKQDYLDNPTFEDIYKIGTIAKIKMIIDIPEGGKRVILDGYNAAEIANKISASPFYMAEVNIIKPKPDNELKVEALFRKVVENIATIQEQMGLNLPPLNNLESSKYNEYTNIMAAALLTKVSDRIFFLQLPMLSEKISMVLELIKKEKLIKEIDQEIDQKLNQQMMEQQRDYHLREKMKLIKEELGEGETKDKFVSEVKEKLESVEIPEHIKEKVETELKRYELTPGNSSDGNVIRSYIDWVMAMPWGVYSPTDVDIEKANNVLNKNHYGMDKVKERIIEYLALKKIKGDFKGTILLLDGPPGVGKTTLAKSIADMLGRKFVKISLGGVKDESEIRGHRRTYLGSNPGRIIQSIRKAGTQNPVFLLDEIDKMGYDYKGDPSAAMLEVLDPEQNKHFSDHYFEEDYDLSDVIFIATSNDISQISRPLLDRMEVIRLDGYTEKEKIEIAKKHIIPQAIKGAGFKLKDIKFSAKAIDEIINAYTMEAGVRDLERNIKKVIRKAAILYLASNKAITIDEKTVKTMLGISKTNYFKKEKENQVGVVMGLAYTSFGGDVLPIEVTTYPGKGKLVLTGKLGDVMKESAQIALSYVKSKAKELKIEPKFFEDNDIHIHAPEGAIPKDGPSAGIALTSAITSALTNKKINNEYAMTGEVTLRGNVLAIGGLKEKSAGALRAGITKIICPAANQKDMEEIPDEIKKKIKYTFVKHVDEVLKLIIIK